MKEEIPTTTNLMIDILNCKDFEFVAIGQTNAGKSSSINSLLGYNVYNTNSARETTAMWRIKKSSNYDKYKLVWRELELANDKELTFDQIEYKSLEEMISGIRTKGIKEA